MGHIWPIGFPYVKISWGLFAGFLLYVKGWGIWRSLKSTNALISGAVYLEIWAHYSNSEGLKKIHFNFVMSQLTSYTENC